MEREMEDLFERFLGGSPLTRWAGDGHGSAPAIDMIDRKDEIVVHADLPGLDEKDIEITVDDGQLSIRGERKEEHETKEEGVYRCERWAGAFCRNLALPPGVDADKIQATFKKGVLEIHLPKTTDAKGKKVEIKAA
jgi:HSP20 family protein